MLYSPSFKMYVSIATEKSKLVFGDIKQKLRCSDTFKSSQFWKSIQLYSLDSRNRSCLSLNGGGHLKLKLWQVLVCKNRNFLGHLFKYLCALCVFLSMWLCVHVPMCLFVCVSKSYVSLCVHEWMYINVSTCSMCLYVPVSMYIKCFVCL